MKSLLSAILLLFLLVSAAFSQADADKKSTGPSPESSYYFILGYQAAYDHDWEEALKNYQKALGFDPNSIYLKTQIVYALYYSGRASEAFALLEEVMKERPDDMNTLLLAGEIYKNQRRLQDAIPVYKKIVKIDPENKDAAFILGGLYYYNNEVDSAIEVLEDLLKKDPEAFQALDMLGAIYLDKKEYGKAADYLKKAVAVNPDLETAYFKLGMISEITDDLTGALEIL